jgi:hypothetical protein
VEAKKSFQCIRHIHGLHPLVGEDAELLEMIARPEFAMADLRNRDVVAALYATPTKDVAEAKRRSARASRLLRLLRAHKLIRKLPNSHRYQVTEHAREVMALVLAARAASTQSLAVAGTEITAPNEASDC